MIKVNRLALAPFILLSMTACQSTIANLPSNVEVVNKYVDTVAFSAPHGHEAKKAFKLARLCVAETISNESVIINDATGTFVGAFSGTVYHANNKTSVGGGQLFQLVDEELGVMILRGTSEYIDTGMLKSEKALKYKLKASIKENNIQIKFSDITHTMKNSGYASNSFNKLGTWSGSGFEGAYSNMQYLKNKIAKCLIT